MDSSSDLPARPAENSRQVSRKVCKSCPVIHVEQTVERFIAVTAVLAGLSHLLRPTDWATAYRRLHEWGRPGAFVNGGLNLIAGGLIFAGHATWTFPGALLTGFAVLLLLKSAVCLLAPDIALRSMRHGGNSPRSFVAAGIVLLMLGAWAGYCVWHPKGAAMNPR